MRVLTWLLGIRVSQLVSLVEARLLQVLVQGLYVKVFCLNG